MEAGRVWTHELLNRQTGCQSPTQGTEGNGLHKRPVASGTGNSSTQTAAPPPEISAKARAVESLRLRQELLEVLTAQALESIQESIQVITRLRTPQGAVYAAGVFPLRPGLLSFLILPWCGGRCRPGSMQPGIRALYHREMQWGLSCICCTCVWKALLGQ